METDDQMETRRKGTQDVQNTSWTFSTRTMYVQFTSYVQGLISGMFGKNPEMSGDQTVPKTIKNLLSINEVRLVVTQ